MRLKTFKDAYHSSQTTKAHLPKKKLNCHITKKKILTKLAHDSCFGYFQGLMVVLLLYRDNDGRPLLICNIHQLMIQRRELLLMTEIQPPVQLPENNVGQGGRENFNF